MLKRNLDWILVVHPSTWRLRHEHLKFEDRLGYIARPYLRKANKKVLEAACL
jgi:hypothetical protein